MRPILILLMVLTAAPVRAQSTNPAEQTAARDSAAGFRPAGDHLRDMPVEDLADALRLIPGIAAGVPFRGIGVPLSVYLDGVPLRRLLPGLTAFPALSVTERVEFLGNPASAKRGDVLGGVLQLATRTPDDSLRIDAGFAMDRFSPSSWRSYQARGEASLSGPVPGVAGLHFVAGGNFSGDQFIGVPRGSASPVYVITGVDTVFNVVQTTGDSIPVAFPEFSELTNAARAPLGNRDRTSVSAGLEMRPPSGQWGMSATVHATRTVSLAKDFSYLYAPFAWDGSVDNATVMSLTGRLAFRGFALSGYASGQRYDTQAGAVDPEWANANAHPLFGVSAAPRFFAEPEDFPADAGTVHQIRSGFAGADTLYPPGVFAPSSNIPRTREPVRLNPYGLGGVLPSQGVGGGAVGYGWRAERHLIVGATIERSIGSHHLQFGAEWDDGSVRGRDVLGNTGARAVAFHDPVRSAAWLEDAATLGQLYVQAGVRAERVDRGGLLQRFPGYQSWTDTVGNFHPMKATTVISPRVFASIPVTSRVTARAAAARFHDPRATYGPRNDPTLALRWSTISPSSSVFTTEVVPPAADVFEFGAATSMIRGVALDASIWTANVHNAYVTGSEEYEDPDLGFRLRVPVWTNSEKDFSRGGVDFNARADLGDQLDATFAYSYVGGAGVSRPHSGALAVAFEPAWSAPVLRGLGLYATGTWYSGSPYRRVEQQGIGTLSNEPVTGILSEGISRRTPSWKQLDMRLVKSFRFRGSTVGLVADFRNPFGIENTIAVYQETGTTENELYRLVRTYDLARTLTPGIVDRRDVVIDNLGVSVLNQYSLHRAEQRFGNGDGTLTVAEQDSIIGAYLDASEGTQWLRNADPSLRLGIELKW
ncbi:MAG TPA: hypothetical protein VF035_04390 [Longimicrobiales bacterium]